MIKICLIVSSIFTAGVWSCPATTGERPPPCSTHTFTAVDDRRAVVFGGFNEEQGKMNDVFIIDLSTMVFKQLVGTMQIKNLKRCPFFRNVLYKTTLPHPISGWCVVVTKFLHKVTVVLFGLTFSAATQKKCMCTSSYHCIPTNHPAFCLINKQKYCLSHQKITKSLFFVLTCDASCPYILNGHAA